MHWHAIWAAPHLLHCLLKGWVRRMPLKFYDAGGVDDEAVRDAGHVCRRHQRMTDPAAQGPRCCSQSPAHAVSTLTFNQARRDPVNRAGTGGKDRESNLRHNEILLNTLRSGYQQALRVDQQCKCM
jgi:hypothetical protein